MESTLQLEIVTPDKVVVSQTVDYVGVPGIECVRLRRVR